MEVKQTFSFGKNWAEFLKSITDEKLGIAATSLKDFLGLDNLAGKSFLDIGCGSGIFSYAASSLDAAKIVSFDVDPFSVQCCEQMRHKANDPAHWQIYHGSILDTDVVSKFGTFDIVYSWGVLHHTGDMWAAIRNSAQLVRPGGYYYIALYNNAGGFLTSARWLAIKKFYNKHPIIGKYFLEYIYIVYSFIFNVFSAKLFFKKIKNYKEGRGMSWRRDISDWMGGYPYQYASVGEVFQFMKKNFPHFQLVNIRSTNGTGNNWFLFKNNNEAPS